MEGTQHISYPFTFNKYLPFALVYFFFNSVFLPAGLLYTSIAAPLLLIWLLNYRSINYVFAFFALTLPFIPIHFEMGVDAWYYFRSYALLFTAFVFGLAFYQFLKICKSIRTIYRNILVINFVFVLIACIAWFTPYKLSFWMVSFVSPGLEAFPRLKMLTYEPSYYCTLLLPIAMYYYLKMIMFKMPNPALIGVLITLPLILSFSLGILLGIPLSLAILFIINIRSFLTIKRVRQLVGLGIFVSITALIVLIIFFPDNPLFKRISNLFANADSSFRGRTVEAYDLALRVSSLKSIWWGVGPGQVKVLGLDIWIDMYNYNFTRDLVAIPCALADTLAVYGIIGAFLRLAFQVYFFFRTRVYNNYYRFALFLFAFIYQFTGSYINNIAEYVIWILAFAGGTFEEFDRKKRLPKNT